SSDSGTVLFSLLISGKEAEILARLSAAPSTPEDLRRLTTTATPRCTMRPPEASVSCRLPSGPSGRGACPGTPGGHSPGHRLWRDGFTLAAAGNHVRLMEFPWPGWPWPTDCGSDGGVNRDGSGGAKFAVEESDGGFRVASPTRRAALSGCISRRHGLDALLAGARFPFDGAGDSAATSPLHAAAAGGCAEACSLVIEQAGASGSRRDINGLTPRQ
uniref:ANK_REP_REGION domain-containing protein n=1 Tax=Macrostomum lignano TaxID=282301 RepID=A0A1I8FRG0_9PLAT